MSRSANAATRSSGTMIITGAVQEEAEESVAGSQCSPSPRTRRRLEPTYRMEPAPEDIFPRAQITDQIRSVLAQKFDGKKYDAKLCNNACAEVANQIKAKVRHDIPERFKIVVFVTVGEQTIASSVKMASRCVWNAKFDRFAEAEYKNGSVYAVGMVYAVYMD